MFSQDDVLRLVDLIYAASCDPTEWPRMLEALCSVIGAVGADIIGVDVGRPSAQIHAAVGLVGAEFQREYLAYYFTCDPYVAWAKQNAFFRPGNVGVGEAIVPFRVLKNTEFYNDFGKRYEYIGGMTAMIAGGGTGGSALGLCRRLNCEFGEPEVQLIHALMPHLQRGLQIHGRLAEAQTRDVAFRNTLDQLATGAILVDHTSRVVFANRSASDILEKKDGLISYKGQLRAHRPQDTSRLHGAIAHAVAASKRETLTPGGMIALGRPSPARPLQLIVSPVPAASDAEPSKSQPLAIVFVIDPDRAPSTEVELFRGLYGFSRAECSVARLLVEGHTVNEISELLFVSVSTVRFHLKQLLAKTGTHRQSELVRLLSATTQVTVIKKPL
jgi:DNA-binding CsgD family transcriptional regulator/PAS domain-containing protein